MTASQIYYLVQNLKCFLLGVLTVIAISDTATAIQHPSPKATTSAALAGAMLVTIPCACYLFQNSMLKWYSDDHKANGFDD